MKSVKKIIGFFVFSVATTLLLGACAKGGDKPGPEPDPKVLVENVSGLSSARLTLGGEGTIGATGAQEDDVVVMKSALATHECEVTTITEKYFRFKVPYDLVAGRYNFTLVRGSKSQNLFDATISIQTVDTYVEDKEGMTLRGKVYCGSKGVQNVLVTDGVSFTKTDKDGKYWLASDKRYAVVYIVLPQGYDVPTQAAMPQFWTATTGSATDHEQHNFELREANNDNHKIMIVTDIHLSNRELYPNDLIQFNKGWVTEMNNLYAGQKNVYCLNLGDFAFDVHWYKWNCDLQVAANQITALPCQFWSTMGNHDNDGHTQDGDDGYWGKDLRASGPFRRIMGPTHISMNIGKIHYMLIDDIKYENDYPGPTSVGDDLMGKRNYHAGFRADMLEWIKQDLSYVDKNTPIVVGMHIPLLSSYGIAVNGEFNVMAEYEAFVGAFKDFKEVEFVTGHTHVHRFRPMINASNMYEHNIGAVCGIWWNTSEATGGTRTSGNTGTPGKLTLCSDGVPAGYYMYDVNGTDRTWKWKSIGWPESKQFKSYDMNQVKKYYNEYAPAKLFAETGQCPDTSSNTPDGSLNKWTKTQLGMEEEDNTVWINLWAYETEVFNGLPAWELTVKENGKDLTVTPIFYGYRDPLAVLTYDIYRFNATETHQFSSSSMSRNYVPHMFKVVASSPTSTLEIRAKDRFGRVYTETMTRPKKFYTGNIADSWTLE